MSLPTPTSLASKNFHSLDIDEIIYLHLLNSNGMNTLDFRIISCLNVVEENMRSANTRDRTKMYAPVLCAFAILDQLGSCYANKTTTLPSGHISSVQRALSHFCGFSVQSRESEYLYAFRNGMVHDASLTSHDRSKSKWYVFRYDNDMPELIKLPNQDWDGLASSIGSNTQTWINRDLFVQSTTNAMASAKDLFVRNRAQFDVLSSKEEIVHKYLLWNKI